MENKSEDVRWRRGAARSHANFTFLIGSAPPFGVALAPSPPMPFIAFGFRASGLDAHFAIAPFAKSLFLTLIASLNPIRRAKSDANFLQISETNRQHIFGFSPRTRTFQNGHFPIRSHFTLQWRYAMWTATFYFSSTHVTNRSEATSASSRKLSFDHLAFVRLCRVSTVNASCDSWTDAVQLFEMSTMTENACDFIHVLQRRVSIAIVSRPAFPYFSFLRDHTLNFVATDVCTNENKRNDNNFQCFRLFFVSWKVASMASTGA